MHLVVDVRTVPRSRTNPQFNRDVLPQALSEFQIGYEHIAALGGLRGRKRNVPPATNAFWSNQSFHNYADYAMSDDYRAALAQLRALGHERRCAIMCAEAVWWRCHRSMIADALKATGVTVLHILSATKVEEHPYTRAAAIVDGRLSYGGEPMAF